MIAKRTSRHLVPAGSLVLVLLFLFAACTADGQAGGRQVVTSADGIALVRVFPSLSFQRPVDLQYSPDGSDYLFVVEQRGRILVFDRSEPQAGASVFLDIRGRVDDTGNEEGLLGLAFHPEYESNGSFFVNYTTANPRPRTVISHFSVQAGGGVPVANKESEHEVLDFNQPYSNHNGGQIAFGPDGYLYIATGDGGAGGDPQNNGQDPYTLLGAILRIDVDDTEGENDYAIPADNPFVGDGDSIREEIFAYGLRNPWRFSFDPQTGELWTGDVGQNAYEEIDIVDAGENYGWNIMEASHCYEPPNGCNRSGLTLPVAEYGHSEGQSVTGGFVYRGAQVPGLSGLYVFADFVSGRFWTIPASEAETADAEVLFDTNLNVSSFGTDRDGEIYALAFDGNLYRFERE